MNSRKVRGWRALVHGQLGDGPDEHQDHRQRDRDHRERERRPATATVRCRRAPRDPRRCPPRAVVPAPPSDRGLSRRRGPVRLPASAGVHPRLPAGHARHCFVGGVQGHPLLDEPGQQRAADDQRRDGDDQPEEQRQPQVGAEGVDGHQRTGVGRDQAVEDRETGQRGNADPHQGDVRPARHEDDDRDQQDHAHLEEQGQPEDGRDQRHRPRQSPGADLADDRVHDGVRPAGVGEQRADHRAQADQQPHRADGAAEAGGEAGDDVERGDPRDDPHHRRAQHQREERVHLHPHDQHHHGGDAEQDGEHDLGVAGVGQVGGSSASGSRCGRPVIVAVIRALMWCSLHDSRPPAVVGGVLSRRVEGPARPGPGR